MDAKASLGDVHRVMDALASDSDREREREMEALALDSDREGDRDGQFKGKVRVWKKARDRARGMRKHHNDNEDIRDEWIILDKEFVEEMLCCAWWKSWRRGVADGRGG